MIKPDAPPEVFYKKAAIKNFEIFTGKHLCWSLFLINLQASHFSGMPSGLTPKETPTQTFSCEYCKIFKNISFLKNNCDSCFQ